LQIVANRRSSPESLSEIVFKRRRGLSAGQPSVLGDCREPRKTRAADVDDVDDDGNDDDVERGPPRDCGWQSVESPEERQKRTRV